MENALLIIVISEIGEEGAVELVEANFFFPVVSLKLELPHRMHVVFLVLALFRAPIFCVDG
jgi:hypothetical protein